MRHRLIASGVLWGTLHVLSAGSNAWAQAPAQTPAETASVHPPDEQQLPARRVTAFSYGAAQHQLLDSLQMHPIVNGHVVLRMDSVRTIVEDRVRTWLSALALKDPTRLFQTPTAALASFVQQDTLFDRLVAEHLADPRLSPEERLWTNVTAFDLLTPHDTAQTTVQLQHALRYLAAIDRFPPSVLYGTRYSVRIGMMNAELRRGDIAAAIRWGNEAYSMVPLMTNYLDRVSAATNEALITFATLLAGEPNARHKIDSLLTFLRPFVPAPSALIAQDTVYRIYGAYQEQAFAGLEAAVHDALGKPNTMLVATHWYKQPVPTLVSDAAPQARLKRLDDDTIRVIGFGWFSCPHCLASWGRLEKIKETFPKGVSVMVVERTEGTWGGDPATPDEEAEHIRHYMHDFRHYTFPLAIWAGPRDRTPDGFQVVREFPMIATHGVAGGPTYLVIDGHGTMRARFGGEDALASWNVPRIVKFLVAEREQANRQASNAQNTHVPAAGSAQ